MKELVQIQRAERPKILKMNFIVNVFIDVNFNLLLHCYYAHVEEDDVVTGTDRILTTDIGILLALTSSNCM